MGDIVVGIPDNYESTKAINDLLPRIEEIDFEGQISVLTTIAGEMG
jgi:hypothetical protein